MQNTKLFVGGLSYELTDAQLKEHFEKAGKVMSAKVITDRYTGKGKGFGFVEMSTPAEMQRAIQELNKTMLDGKILAVKEAKPQEERQVIKY